MNKIKFSHLVFSLALIAALVLAVFPMVPAYALSASTAHDGIAADQVHTTVLTPESGGVCRSIVIWRNGHRTVIRRCHHAANPAS